MFRKLLLIGFFVLAPACAHAGESKVQTFTIYAGQGQAITVTIPVAEYQSPYALTGEQASAPLRLRSVRLGQGGDVWISEVR